MQCLLAIAIVSAYHVLAFDPAAARGFIAVLTGINNPYYSLFG